MPTVRSPNRGTSPAARDPGEVSKGKWLFVLTSIAIGGSSGCSHRAEPPIISAPTTQWLKTPEEREAVNVLERALRDEMVRIELRNSRGYAHSATRSDEFNPTMLEAIAAAAESELWPFKVRFSPSKSRIASYDKKTGRVALLQNQNGQWTKVGHIQLPKHQDFRLDAWIANDRFLAAYISYTGQSWPWWSLKRICGQNTLLVDFEKATIYQVDNETRGPDDYLVVEELGSE